MTLKRVLFISIVIVLIFAIYIMANVFLRNTDEPDQPQEATAVVEIEPTNTLSPPPIETSIPQAAEVSSTSPLVTSIPAENTSTPEPTPPPVETAIPGAQSASSTSPIPLPTQPENTPTPEATPQPIDTPTSQTVAISSTSPLPSSIQLEDIAPTDTPTFEPLDTPAPEPAGTTTPEAVETITPEAVDTATPAPGDIPSTPTPAATSPPQPLVSAGDSNINIRRGPGTNYEVIDRLPAGQSLTIVGRNEDASWWQVPAQDGLGWIAASVTTASNVENVPVVETPPPPTPP